MKTPLLVVALAIVGAQAAPSGPCGVGRVVETDSGRVQGHPADGAPLVSEYLGIPYAQPPVGDLRFQPPAAFEGDSVINGTNFVCCDQMGYRDEAPLTSTGFLLLPASDHGCHYRHHYQAGNPSFGFVGVAGAEPFHAAERGLFDAECLEQETTKQYGETSARFRPWRGVLIR